ncbi:MAG: hypothetical protein J6S63_12845 [Atopobiaceae bacterium]|nr:hypothetical protein [Atopobiaceae bacterium]
MSRVVPYAITLLGLACMAFIVVGISQPVPHPETYLAVTDKPYVAAQVAQEEAEAYEPEPYYEPVCYNSYWYESDDAEAEAAAKEWIAWRESGGDYGARNGQYVGRYQLNEMYLDGDYSEENQEEAVEAYIADRYGSWQAAQEHWQEYGWY